MLDLFLQQLVNGLTIGFGYAVVATGLALIFGIMRIVNFAHGEFFALGAYALYAATESLGLSYVWGGVLAVVAVAAFGLLVQCVVIEPMARAHHLNTLLGTFAVGLAIHYSLVLGVGSTGRQLHTPFDDTLAIGPVVLTEQKLFIVVAGLAIFAALAMFLRSSPLGKLMRGTAENRQAAIFLGVNVKMVERITFCLGTSLAALGGVLMGPLAPITPDMGSILTLKAFAVIVLGGMGSVFGAMLAGVLLGVSESLAAGYLSGAWKDAIAFALLIAMLIFRPSGLFGRSGA